MSPDPLPRYDRIQVLRNYRDERSRHWDARAERAYRWGAPARAYHERLLEIYRLLVAEGARVIELGCGTGDLLAALRPGYGVGVDISERMLEIAAEKYPTLRFIRADARDLGAISETFDFVVLSDLLNELHDVQAVFKEVRSLCDQQWPFAC